MASLPRFRLSQTDEHVVVHVSLPSDCACLQRVVVDGGNIFGLACKHVYLPLVFAKDALQNGAGREQADPYEGSSTTSLTITRDGPEVIVRVRKAKPGQTLDGLEQLKPSLFPVEASGDAHDDEEERLAGLEMLQRGIDVMKSANEEVLASNRADNAEDEAADLQSTLPRAPVVQRDTKTRIHECFDAMSKSADERRQVAVRAEEAKWDEGMYLDGFVDQEGEIAEIVGATLPTDKIIASPTPSSRSPLSDATALRDMHLLLIDLLLAHGYDHRTMLGDPTVESGWTIAVLSRSLAGSCTPCSAAPIEDSAHSVLRASVRRQLCYCLYRSWTLSLKVAADVCAVLRQENSKDVVRTRILQIALRFEEGDDDALEVYMRQVIQPLLFWYEVVFSVDSLASLASELERAANNLTKHDVGGSLWELALLEEAAQETMAEGEGGFV